MKSEALRQLETLAFEQLRAKYPRTPLQYLPKCTYSDKTANGLTKCIIDFIRLQGWQAERVSVQGRYIDNSKVVSDCLGNRRKIGSGKYIPSSMQKGSADISATINGRSVKIEVKIGRDKQSDEQKQYQSQVESAGGVYLIAKDFQSFFEWYKNFLTKSQSLERI